MACERITAGITRAMHGRSGRSRPCSIPTIPTGSTSHVNFNTSKTDRWETDARRCHINWVILDSDWEAEFCRVAESHPRVRAYVKNHNLGFEVPYRYGSEMRQYRPGLHRAGGRWARRGRSAAPGRRDQGLSARGRQGEEDHDGDLLGAGREQPAAAMAAGPSRSSPRSTRSRPTSRRRSRGEFDKMIESVASAAAPAGSRKLWPMAKAAKPRKTVETLTHDEATRKNIPTAEYQSVMAKEEQSPIRVAYERRNRDLDPQLVWRGKDEQDWSDLVVHAPPLYIQEKVHPKVLIDDLLRADASGQQAAAEITDRPVRRLQRPAEERRQDRVLPARRRTGRTA